MNLTYLRKVFLGLLLIVFSSMLIISFTTKTAVKPSEASDQKGEGYLLTNEGLKFYYKFYPSDNKGPSVIYLPDLGGKASYHGPNSGGYALAPLLNKGGFNYIACDYHGSDRWDRSSLQKLIKDFQARGKSGFICFPTIDGKESSSENIVRNEVKSLIEFLETVPTHDSKQGIYLIGASQGCWVSLVTVYSFPEKIKGAVLVSPGVLSDWPEWSKPEKYPNLDAAKYFSSLLQTFGKRPALAIGGPKDIIWPGQSTESAWDSAKFLRNEIGENLELMKVERPDHASILIENSKEVREKIVRWLKDQTRKD